MAESNKLARSFGTEAGAYEAARPEYPAGAVAWALAPITPAF